MTSSIDHASMKISTMSTGWKDDTCSSLLWEWNITFFERFDFLDVEIVVLNHCPIAHSIKSDVISFVDKCMQCFVDGPDCFEVQCPKHLVGQRFRESLPECLINGCIEVESNIGPKKRNENAFLK